MDNSQYLNRHQRRAAEHDLKKARPGFDRVMDADRAFFTNTPERSYRLRKASRPEVLDLAAHHGLPGVPADGYEWFVIVHQVRPDFRQRQITAMPAGTDTGVDEARARELWEEGAPTGSLPHQLAAAAREFGL